MIAINPLVWKSVVGLVTATGFGHLALVTSAAIGSTVVNYYLARNGQVFIIKSLNRALWVSAGIIALDLLFSVGQVMSAMFHL